MSNDSQHIQEIFHRIAGLPIADRSAAVERECGVNAALRDHVAALLKAHDAAGGRLEAGSDAFTATYVAPARSTEEPATDIPSAELPFILNDIPKQIAPDYYPHRTEAGMVIGGRYTLQQKIGDGGMGEVWLARQTEPVKRQVALKLIKSGTDSKAVLGRFEQERQALAMMDHPNIARVLDGGVTSTGQPFFVMELVKGLTLTRFCDEARLTPRQRLELFVPICQAVQHAHQKGIVHRDLKPGNILVTLVDGCPVPKVIDFGVAKATGGKLTEETMSTQFGAIVGTLEYMAPEQSGYSAGDIDTRADIYSLGVILYEMLTGLRPFDTSRLKQAAVIELIRVIQEEEPSKPSTRLSTNDALPSLAALRQTDPRKLTALLRGELDWVVMKCLDKSRDRRYETANALGRDVQRYLADEPVEARPPSPGYRLEKFLKRNKGPVIALSLVLLALLGGVVGTTFGLVRAIKAEHLAEERFRDAEQQRRKATELAAVEAAQRQIADRRRQEADEERERANRNFRTARDAVDRMLTRVAHELRGQPQTEQVRRALLDDALQYYQGFLKEKSDDPAIRYETGLSLLRIGNLYSFLGNWQEGIDKLREAIAIFGHLVNTQPKQASYRERLAECHQQVGRALHELNQYDASIAEYDRAISLWNALTLDWPDRPSYLQNSAQANWEVVSLLRRRYLSARSTPYANRSRELLSEIARRFPDFHIDPLLQSGALAVVPSDQANPNQKELVGPILDRDYSHLPHDTKTLQQYEQELLQKLAYWDRQAEAHPDAPSYQRALIQIYDVLAKVLMAQDRFDDLLRLSDRHLELCTRMAARYPDNVEYQVTVAWSQHNRGDLLYHLGRKEEAMSLYRTAIAAAKARVADFPNEKRLHTHLAGMLLFNPFPELRDPPRALQAARREIELVGDQGDWAELAFAQFRSGQPEEALQSILKAQGNSEPPPAFEVFEAMIQLDLKQVDKARQKFQHAVDLLDKTSNKIWYTFQCRFVRTEFEARLKASSPP